MKSVSIITPTYNSIRTIQACINSLKAQNYPKHLLEHIVSDGGSTDGTLNILKSSGAKILNDTTGSPEYAKANALKTAKGEYILFLASDNILPHPAWLSNMVKSLEKDPELVAAYPLYYGWRRSDKSLTRYFSLLGANDPVAWFLGKADRAAYLQTTPIKDDEVVTFTESNMPTLGDNGFLIKSHYLKHARVDSEHFYHIDVCMDLVKQGFHKFIIINDVIIHDTGESVLKFFNKRYRYMKQLYLNEHHRRRYQVFNSSRDWFRLILFFVYTITLIGPVIYSLKGFLHKHDIAWFYHPLICAGLLAVYTVAIINHKISQISSSL